MHSLVFVDQVIREVVERIPRPERYHGFHVIDVRSRRFAAIEYGGYYDGGAWDVWLLVDLGTGAFSRVSCFLGTPKDGANLVHEEDKRHLGGFDDSQLIPDDDPIRRWLAGNASPLPITTDDQLRRYSAVEIVRSDRPDICPCVELDNVLMWKDPTLGPLVRNHDPDDLPYFVLFGKHVQPVDHLGSGQGRRRPPVELETCPTCNMRLPMPARRCPRCRIRFYATHRRLNEGHVS